MKEVNLNINQFFRYFAPGGVGILYALYLRYYEIGSFRFIEVKNLGEGALILFLSALLGYVFSTCYHAIINWNENLRPNHTNFFKAATKQNLLRLEYYPDQLELNPNSAPIEDRLSSQGAAALFDSSFYRLREEITKVQGEALAGVARFESFFHVLHGLGASIIGVFLVSVLWILRAISSGYSPSTVRIYFWILPLLGGSIAIINWFQLKKMSIAYVEGWYLSMLKRSRDSRRNNPSFDSEVAVLEVRPSHLKKLKHQNSVIPTSI